MVLNFNIYDIINFYSNWCKNAQMVVCGGRYALMDTIIHCDSVKRIRHFQPNSALVIGHTKLPGVQRVLWHPFPGKQFHVEHRQDLVFVRPPGVTSVWASTQQSSALVFFSDWARHWVEGSWLHLRVRFVEYDQDRPGICTIWVIDLYTSKYY